jgi:arabinogalactan endo-1,4-beta-galactosidase
VQPLETILKNAGVNTVRQRIWVNPSDGNCTSFPIHPQHMLVEVCLQASTCMNVLWHEHILILCR